jgi:hypothetical protein
MALNADTLGQALHDARQSFNDQTMDQLTAAYSNLDGVRLAMAKADAAAIINHFKSNGIVLPGTFANSGGTVAGTGTIE